MASTTAGAPPRRAATPPRAGTTGLTYADTLAWPAPNEAGGTRYELLDGELLVSPAPAIRHQRGAMRISAAILRWTDANGGDAFGAAVDVVFSDDTVFEPDVVAFAADRADRIGDKYVSGAPSLVVEVSASSTRRTDLVRKRPVYEREGVAEFWFVDLDADRVEVSVLGEDGTYGPPTVVSADGDVVSHALPGFAMPASEALALGHP